MTDTPILSLNNPDNKHPPPLSHSTAMGSCSNPNPPTILDVGFVPAHVRDPSKTGLIGEGGEEEAKGTGDDGKGKKKIKQKKRYVNSY